VYQEDVLQVGVKQLEMTLFSGQEWVFQQDSVPAQNQDDPGVAADEFSGLYQRRRLAPWESRPQHPGLLWAVVEDMACQKHHNNLDSLKRSLIKAAAMITLETVRAAMAEWPERLKACVEAEGGHFEWHYYIYNLKLWLIDYLVPKIECSVSFSF
jgi:hypothetical protein